MPVLIYRDNPDWLSVHVFQQHDPTPGNKNCKKYTITITSPIAREKLQGRNVNTDTAKIITFSLRCVELFDSG